MVGGGVEDLQVDGPPQTKEKASFAAKLLQSERSLLTLLGDVGPWRERIYLAGAWLPGTWPGRSPRMRVPMALRTST